MTRKEKHYKINYALKLAEAQIVLRYRKSFFYYMRACTGFDGGFEVEEAIRRLRDCVLTWNLNINANNNRVALAA